MKIQSLLCLFFLISCAQHTEVAPPEVQNYQRLLSASPLSLNQLQELPKNQQWAFKYASAFRLHEKNDLKNACLIFTELSQIKAFPLRHLSKLRSLKTCTLSDKEKRKEIFMFHRNHLRPETREEFLRFATHEMEAIEDSLSNFTAKLFQQLSSVEKNLEAKIKSQQTAIKKARSKHLKNRLIKELKELAPRFVEDPTSDNIIEVARDHERGRDFDKARQLYQQALNSEDVELEDRLYALERMALSYKVQRSLEAYLRKLDETAKEIRSLAPKNEEEKSLLTKALIETEITQARAIWTAHNRERGEKILRRALENEHISTDHQAQIHYILGAMALEADDMEKALQLFKDGLKYPTEDQDIKELLSWSWGHNLFLLKRFKKAIEAFDVAIEQNQEEPLFQSKLIFWKAMAFQNLENQKQAVTFFEETIQKAPHSYYAILAQHKLGLPFTPLHATRAHDSLDSVFEWLVFFKEKQSSRTYITHLVDKGEIEKDQAIQAYSRASLHHEAIFEFARQSEDIPLMEWSSYFSYIYPTEYLTTYRDFAQRYGIPYELALSITRQESAFNPDARSWADAFGLMQLIPEKAESISKSIDVDYKHFSDLYQPELNIQLGSFLLSKLNKRYENEYPFFIAAYNAGDGPVQNWRKHRYEGKTLEFVEMIPYSETQKYVKLILRNMVIYRRLTTSREFTLEDLNISIL